MGGMTVSGTAKGTGAGASAGGSIGAAAGGLAGPEFVAIGGAIGAGVGAIVGAASTIGLAQGIGDAVDARGGEWVLDHPAEARELNGGRDYPRIAAYRDLIRRQYAGSRLFWCDGLLVWRAPSQGFPSGALEIVDYDLRDNSPAGSHGKWDANGLPSAYRAAERKGPFQFWHWSDWLTVGWPVLSQARADAYAKAADGQGEPGLLSVPGFDPYAKPDSSGGMLRAQSGIGRQMMTDAAARVVDRPGSSSGLVWLLALGAAGAGLYWWSKRKGARRG
jgi:hypothetical protein